MSTATYGVHMDFEKVVAPLLTLVPGTDKARFGSGFFVRIEGEVFLTTTAHLCDFELAPRAEWDVWAKQIFLIDASGPLGEEEMTTLANFELFTPNHDNERVPRFKYLLRAERPGTIADLILIPIQTDNPVLDMYDTFDLPADIGAHMAGEMVTQLGRRSDFPALSVAQHYSTQSAGPVRIMFPNGQEGDSGGPAIDKGGNLVGMNVGSHVNLPDHAMLMSPEAIVALAASVNGVAPNWPQFAPAS
ncbi:hypothetical protein [Arthrobacter psychrochitiniphilus]|uniref:hypothetical protein n=1 Tax=Arthrobacter psychrochitiniphilus TaxID=291045 RepID=UPI003F7CCC29